MYGTYDAHFKPEEVIAYLRKSRSDDPTLTVEEVLQKHEAILDEWSESHLGGLVPEENKYREVVSGETIDDRPQIKEVLARIESPRIKAVLVVEVQRLSRGDLEDAGRLMKLLRYTNTLVITPPRTYNLQDEYDRDYFERELKRGNEFLEYQKRIMSRGRLLSVQQGNFIATTAPYGYEKTFVSDGKRKCPTLKIKESEADVVRMIFDLYVNQDMGRTRICNRLDALGIPAPKGHHWSPPALADLLNNITYIGKVRWNYRKTVTVVDEGEIIQTRPKSKLGDYLIFEGKHEPIISEELFQAAQEKQGRNYRAKAATKIRNPLSTLLYCKCGYAMVFRVYRKNGKDVSSPRLLCNNQAHCGTPSCLYDEMLDRICEVLQGCINDFTSQLQNGKEGEKDQLQILIQRLQDRMSALEKKEISQWDKYTEGEMPKAIFERLNEKLQLDKKETAQELEKATNLFSSRSSFKERIFRFRKTLDALRNPDVSAEAKNLLLKSCIERIEYDRPQAEPGAPLPPFSIDVQLRL